MAVDKVRSSHLDIAHLCASGRKWTLDLPLTMVINRLAHLDLGACYAWQVLHFHYFSRIDRRPSMVQSVAAMVA